MTSFLKNNFNFSQLTFFVVTVFLLSTSSVSADDTSQTLSVSPTLIQISVTPGQGWNSELRVFNVNNYDLEIFPQVVNFAPSGEAGQGEMIPINSAENQGKTLAEWVDISSSSIIIPRQQTATLPFTVNIPIDAAPGGHYAAILIGTRPSQNEKDKSQVLTTQYVTSLLFTKVAGDVVESGLIREFNSSFWFVSKPEVSFSLRFENKGNVHLQPQGDIQIYNMWGSERGSIPVNYQTHFGNVLPKSIRKFDFTWSSENSLLDSGRYKAILTLGYGEQEKKFVTSTTYFWIIPIKQIVIFSIITLLFLWFLSFAVKLYIRRMLTLAGLNPSNHYQISRNQHSKSDYYNASSANTVVVKNYKTLTEPVRTGLVDFAGDIKEASSIKQVVRVLFTSIKNYKIFIIFIVITVISIIFIVYYFSEVRSKNHSYNVTIDSAGSNIAISSEQIFYTKQTPLEKAPKEDQITEQKITVDILNSSGILGLGAKTRLLLESYNYKINQLESVLNRTDEKTVIIYNQENQKDALALSKIMGEALLSIDDATPQNTLKIYVGQDMDVK